MDIKKDIRFIFCSFVPVGLEDYVEYMRGRFSDFIYFKWRFHFVDPKKISSGVSVYDNGKLISERKLLQMPKLDNRFIYFIALPAVYFLYLFQAVKNLILVKKGNRQVVFMGVNFFCTLCGIALKALGAVDFVIYRVMDFFPLPERGIYRILHRVFYIIDKVCLNSSDAIWFTTTGHIEGREKYGYFNRARRYYEIIPLGVRKENIASVPFSFVRPYSIVYCGVISRYHLLDLLFDAVGNLKTKHPGIRLNIIGSGPDESLYKEYARELGLSENISFCGFIKDKALFAKTVSENAIGIALYRDEENFMKYTEPAKVKTYLSYGVPVIVSSVPAIAEEIVQNRVGFSVRNNMDELVRTIENFLNNKELQEEYRRNITGYITRFDINTLLDNAFKNTFERMGI